ncbi:MAG TPA: CYTH domain-containing protein [Myxococcota bacterium]|nr:CYTH domain-containing protein [Myxococcota bacterium]
MKKEIELKYLLESKSDFNRFKRFLAPFLSGDITLYQQENCYFDTPILHLKRKGLSLRLRKENNAYSLSAKQSLKKRGALENLSVRLEYEAAIETSVAKLIKSQLLSPLDAFFILPATTANDRATKMSLHQQMTKAAKLGLQMIGSFHNLRAKLPIKLLGHDVELEFDHCVFPKSVEIYEVEVEFSSEQQANNLRKPLEDLFAAAGIITHQSSSKSSRLYKLLYG